MKILIAGPFQCGKSTYIQDLDNNSINISTRDKNNNICTIGMDIGAINLNGMNLSLFGLPGLLRFKTMRSVVTEGADGIIFMFDASKPETDDAALQILNEIREQLPRNIPIVYVVNKMDLPNARSVEVVREQNYIHKNAPIFGISALKKIGLIEPLINLSELIKKEMIPIIKILKEFQNNPLGLKRALDLEHTDDVTDLLNSMELRGIISINRQKMIYTVNASAANFLEA